MLLSAGRAIMNSEAVAGKPQTAVTSWIERACDPRTEDSAVVGILPELVAVINLQSTGPTEASRAIRKKLKYGDVKRQMRAVQVLESLVLNCGERFQTTFANERLVDRIKIMAGDPQVDAAVKKRIMVMLASWQRTFADDPRMSLVAGLYKACGGGQARAAREAKEAYLKDQERLAKEELERRDRKAAEKLAKEEQRLREKEDKLRAKQRPTQSGQRRQFVMEQEKPLILQSVAMASQSANNLVNSLQHVNREEQSVASDPKVQEYLAKTKEARKKVVRYTQLVPDHDPQGEFLGMLLNTNEQVMAALQLYDRMSKPVELDSDDEADIERLTAIGKSHGTVPTVETGELADTASVSDDASIRARMEAASLYEDHVGEVDRLQARQRLAVMRHNSGYGQGGLGGYGADLAGLDFAAGAGPAASASSTRLPPPIQPQYTRQSAASGSSGQASFAAYGAQSGAGALSDYSDYDSSEGEDSISSPRPTGAATLGGGSRGYDQYLGEGERSGIAHKGLLSEAADDEADPFADPDEVSTPGIHDKRMTWAEI